MAPNCPEDLDVFSVPHSRMKELVKKYLNMVSEINFADTSHLTNLLENLVNTFKEFKAHEQIENKYIMKKLKDKLKALSIRNTALCNCHSDNRLTDMLELVEDGYKCTQKSDLDRKNFGLKLRKALEDFTEQFIPHMEEEEEVFQPMLIKYFTSDELRRIKFKVLEKHFHQGDSHEKEKLCVKPDLLLSDSSDEESEKPSIDSLVTELTKDKATAVDRLPTELVLKIFSYLSPKDLGNCAQVSHQWNTVALDGSLWRNLYPVQWAKGLWSFTFDDDIEEDENDLTSTEEECGMVFYDEDADIDESEDINDSVSVKKMKRETSMLACMVHYILPKVGHSVKTINLAYSQGLVNSLLYKILSLCPNVESLDLKHTRISDVGFKGMGKNGCGSNLIHIDLSGCQNITDTTLQRLANALHAQYESVSMECFPNEKNETEASEKGDNSIRSGELKDRCQQFKFNMECKRDISIHQKNKTSLKCDTRTNLKADESHKLTNNHESILPKSIAIHGCKQIQTEMAYLNFSGQHRTFKCCHRMEDETNRIQSSQYELESKCASVDNEPDLSTIACGLQYLSVSGCSHITDKGLRALVEGNHTYPELRFLDLSGCDKVTSGGLVDIVSVCDSLDHQYLFYCDNLINDPYFESASGCQNIECPTRACCQSGP